MDAAYDLADKVMMITPARFLFNAGHTSKEWNAKMLNDEHLKIVDYKISSKELFDGHDIKGGIAISYRDATKSFGAIKVFTSYKELRGIMTKVMPLTQNTLDSICITQNRFDVEFISKHCPEHLSELSDNGKDKRIKSNAFDNVTLFHEDKNDGDVSIIGVMNNVRTWRYIKTDYIDMFHENIKGYKVIVPASNGSGALGEVLSTPLIGTPLIGTPLIGYTQTFIGFGNFNTMTEAENCMKYIKSKFARTMLGILKITQANTRECWRLVPIQDFTSNSDIDWNKSISDIDKRLYQKYGLSDDEINFIETHVKEMN